MNDSPEYRKRRNIKLLLLVLIFVCVLCTAPFYYDRLLFYLRNILAPRTEFVEISKPNLLNEFSNGLYELSWADDESSITVHLSNWSSSTPDAPNTIATLSLETNETIFREDANSGKSTGLDGNNDFELDETAQIWTSCDLMSRIVAAGGFDTERYWLKYWENSELVDTYYFESKQWPVDYYTPHVSIEFSPSCEKAFLILSGWITYEAEGREELWVLDFSSQSFERSILGKGTVFGLWDYPVQDVTPSWSPGENQFVFGGWGFGLEIFDLLNAKRRYLAGTQYNLHNAAWSPSGKWIAAIQAGTDVDRMFIFSSDGSMYSFTDTCYLITNFWWAPKTDKLVYVCNDDCNELCPESCDNSCGNDCEDPCENYCPRSDYLWLWDLE